ncbi:tellurite resistance TerB family protein [Vibrio anguillarum]|uniref:tellurite resistance TerB family protein n=1 Tax=Vibrio anguillarum TaxID=55601 RepID=UPI0018FEFF60|nr:tellurite resistance TerB family protein [Vibrio anguillarum]MBF4423960.1 tellurite resistance TerB family protein [Vibrio anguillarum]
MDLKSLLNQALNSDIVKQGSSQLGAITQDSNKLKTLGAGALGGGLIGLLMGSKKAKKIGTKVIGIGGAAALGALAYKAYNDWQAKQTTTQPQSSFDPNDASHSTLILKAMIAAAKADGHVDEQEMAKIEQAISEMGADNQLQQLVKNELHKPLDPAAIAQLATTPAQASELYLASLLIADEQNFMEKAYLNELAKQLQLADDLVMALEQQVNA